MPSCRLISQINLGQRQEEEEVHSSQVEGFRERNGRQEAVP